MSSDVCVHFVGGGLAGITAASATYPLDLVRTCLVESKTNSELNKEKPIIKKKNKEKPFPVSFEFQLLSYFN